MMRLKRKRVPSPNKTDGNYLVKRWAAVSPLTSPYNNKILLKFYSA